MNELEPALRMAISSVNSAALYLERLPETPGLHRAKKDLADTVERLKTYAARQGIDLRERMKT